MSLSEDLVSQFVKVTNDSRSKSKETTVYGATRIIDDKVYVKIDGADNDQLTPVETTVEVNEGERVTVLIKNHTATITGNTSVPSASTGTVQELGDRVDNIVANSVTTEYLNATYAKIGELEATNANIENLKAENAEIKNLKADKAEIGTLIAEDATIKRLDAEDAAIRNLVAETAAIANANVVKLEATDADINNLEADVGKIDTLIFGSASGDTIQTDFSNSVIAQVGDAQIKDAMIANVSAGKITAGEIITNNVNVKSNDNSLVIKDATMQISDSTRVRVQIGKDASNDYSINVWDADGNLMFSKGGITDSAIKEAIIRNDMVADDAAISGGKIDMESLFETMNGSTYTLKTSKIYYDDESQTLDVVFKALSEKTDGLEETVASQGTALSVVQGQISSKIWEQDITTTVEDILGDVEIGGRNLFLDTNTEASLQHATSTWSTAGTVTKTYSDGVLLFENGTGLDNYYIYYENDSMTNWLEPSTTYAISFDILTDAIPNMRIGIANNSYTAVQAGLKDVESEYLANEWNHIEFCVTTKDSLPTDTDLSEQGLYLHLKNATIKSVQLKNLKLEKGDKATSWSSAPEDTRNAIETLSTKYSDIQQTVDSINTTVASHTTEISKKADSSTVTATNDKVTKLEQDLNGFKTTVQNTYTTQDDVSKSIQASESKFEQTAEEISLGVAQTTVETALEDYYTAEEVESKIKISTEGITSTVATKSDIEDALASIEVGGRNLLLNSSGYTYLIHDTEDSSKFANISDYGKTKLTVDQTVTISFDIGSPRKDAKLYVYVRDDTGACSDPEKYITVDDAKRYSITTTITKNGSLYCVFKGSEWGTGAVHKVKLELGNVATDWSDAPEDLKNRVIAAETKITQTESSITSQASEITAHGTKISTLEQTASGFEARLTNTAAAATAAAKTATNYLNFSNGGLVVGNHSGDTLKGNVLIDTDSVDIRNGTTVLSSFGADTIELGKNNKDTTIKLCGGTGSLSAYSYESGGATYYDGLRLDSDTYTRMYGNYGTYISTGPPNDSGKSQSIMNVYRYSKDGDTSAHIGSHHQTTSGTANYSEIDTFAASDDAYMSLATASYVYDASSETTKLYKQTLEIGYGETTLTGTVGSSSIRGPIRPWNVKLWSGSHYMNETQTATLDEAISVQPTGIVLVFRGYRGTGVTSSGLYSYFIPKQAIADGPGLLYEISWPCGVKYIYKRLYINDTTITGYSGNDDDGVTTNSSITADNTYAVLWRVYGV